MWFDCALTTTGNTYSEGWYLLMGLISGCEWWHCLPSIFTFQFHWPLPRCPSAHSPTLWFFLNMLLRSKVCCSHLGREKGSLWAHRCIRLPLRFHYKLKWPLCQLTVMTSIVFTTILKPGLPTHFFPQGVIQKSYTSNLCPPAAGRRVCLTNFFSVDMVIDTQRF